MLLNFWIVSLSVLCGGITQSHQVVAEQLIARHPVVVTLGQEPGVHRLYYVSPLETRVIATVGGAEGRFTLSANIVSGVDIRTIDIDPGSKTLQTIQLHAEERLTLVLAGAPQTNGEGGTVTIEITPVPLPHGLEASALERANKVLSDAELRFAQGDGHKIELTVLQVAKCFRGASPLQSIESVELFSKAAELAESAFSPAAAKMLRESAQRVSANLLPARNPVRQIQRARRAYDEGSNDVVRTVVAELEADYGPTAHPTLRARLVDTWVLEATEGRPATVPALEDILRAAGEAGLGDEPLFLAAEITLAGHWVDSGAPARGLEDLENALNRLSQQGPAHASLSIRALDFTVVALIRLGRNEEALELKEDLVTRLKGALEPDHSSTTGHRHKLANLYNHVGQQNAALEQYKGIRVLLEQYRGPQDLEYLTAVEYEGLYLKQLGDNQARDELLDQVHDKLLSLPSPSPAALHKIRSQLAESRRSIGDFEGAYRVRLACYEYEKQTRGTSDLVTLRWGMIVGESLRDIGRYEESLKLQSACYDTLLQVEGPLGFDSYLVRSRYGGTLESAGDVEGSLLVYEELLKGLEASSGEWVPQMQTTRIRLASALKSMGDVQRALQLEEEVLEVYSTMPSANIRNVMIVTENLANSHQLLGNLERSREIMLEVLAWRIETLPPSSLALLRTKQNLSSLCVSMNRLEEAVTWAQESYDGCLESRGPDDVEVLRAQAALGTALLLAGELEESRSALMEVEERFQAQSPRFLLEQYLVRTTLVRCLRNLGQEEEAWEYLTQVVAFARDKASSVSTTLGLSVAEQAQERPGAFLDLLLSWPADRDAVSRLQLQAVVDFRGAADRRGRVRSRLAEWESSDEELAELLNVAREGAAGTVSISRSTEDLESQIARALSKKSGYQRLINTPSISELTALLPKNSVALVSARYSSIDGWNEAELNPGMQRPAWAIFLLTPDGKIQVKQITEVETVVTLCREVRSHVSKGLSLRSAPGVGGESSGKTTAQPLASLSGILQCVLGSIPPGTQRLYIVPDNELATIPWAALSGPDGRPLAASLQVVHLENLAALEPRQGSLSSAGLLVVGGVDYGDAEQSNHWPALPGSQAEVQAVAMSFQKAHTKAQPALLTGASATRTNVMAAVSGNRFLHLATHGAELANGDYGIVLAQANQDGNAAILKSEQLTALDLAGCELAVLSACYTNVGEQVRGRSVTGLNRGLQLAGVRHTITSLWAVSDAGTRAFFEAFYTGLWSDGLSIPSAFGRAQNEVRAAGWGPELWGGFVLYMSGPE